MSNSNLFMSSECESCGATHTYPKKDGYYDLCFECAVEMGYEDEDAPDWRTRPTEDTQ